MSALTVIAHLLIFAGVIVFAGAGVGVLTFRDAYMRASAVGTAAGLGIALITIGAVLTMPTPANLVKAAIAVVLQLITAAVGSTIVARSAVNSGHAFSPDTDLTDLDEVDAEFLLTAQPGAAGARQDGSRSAAPSAAPSAEEHPP